MKFQYSPTRILDSRGKLVKRPMLVVELEQKSGGNIETYAVVDSGADTTTVHKQFAEALGVELGEEGEIIGIGKEKVKRWMGTLSFRIKQTNIALTVPALYVDSPNVNILLGQEVFFDTFRIKFEKDHNTFEITPAPKK